jgi:hypothetical protein
MQENAICDHKKPSVITNTGKTHLPRVFIRFMRHSTPETQKNGVANIVTPPFAITNPESPAAYSGTTAQ